MEIMIMEANDFFDMPVVNYDTNRDLLIANMNMLKDMTNEEHVLYKKWLEIQQFGKYIGKSAEIKANIWQPRDLSNKDMTLEDINNLDPEIILAPNTDKSLVLEWLLLRVFIHTMEFEQNPGRFLRFMIRDKKTGKYLGVSSLGSDILNVSCRDKWIGWSEEEKMTNGKIRHSAIATTIVSTQPFGYNFLGGKLVASLMCTPPIQEAWRSSYDETLVGLTTTSLYGKHSMYQRIPFWKELGETSGQIMLKPDDDIYDIWHHWIKENKKEEYDKKTEGTPGSGPATGVKQKILVMIMQELKMKQSTYMHGFQRGVYYAQLYENTNEFLRGDIDESKLVPSKKLTKGVESVMAWWRPKAIARYCNLLEQNRLNNDTLFYNSLFQMSWEDTKKQYLSEVGR